ncbi:MAG: hypothetical protein LBG72_07050, partial [Spirochaetaceae bacterium]|nr:hypothetical protein [Spirochaetaceae bacterium]
FYEKLGGTALDGTPLLVDTTANYSLAANIDLSTYTGASGAWQGPSGYSGHLFGNGYTITGLVLDGAHQKVGLFTSLEDGATLENFTVQASTPNNQPVELTQQVWFGGILAMVADPAAHITIKDITIEGNLALNGEQQPPNRTIIYGGFLGEVQQFSEVTIENCVSKVNITAVTASDSGIPNTVGGFMGRLWKTGTSGTVTLKRCYAIGDIAVSTTNGGIGGAHVGGLVGDLTYGAGEGGTVEINECYASGKVSLINNGGDIADAGLGVGGLVGLVWCWQTQTGMLNVIIQNSAAVGLQALMPASTNAHADNQRLVGVSSLNTSYFTVTLTNNIARSGMLLGASPGTANTAAGAADSKAGLAKTEALLKTSSTWTSLGWSAAIWDFDGLTKSGSAFYWPRLK